MTPEQYQRVRDIFHEVADLPSAKQDAAIEQLAEGDASVAAEVRALLGEDVSHTETPGFLKPVFEAPPEQVGEFRIIDVLGSGGMGVVYRAEQRQPRRMVALKIVSVGFGSDIPARRLRREAELLARLHHPGIAQIYEAGAIESNGRSRPYFAMELVDGESITAYGANHTLDVRAKLQLIIELCEAVQHAHENGVIHRDLKPSNVFVTNDGRVKVLDFGVGRLVERDSPDATLRTFTGELVGTVAYMSPEQAAGDPSAVDARSDVYAIGVIAYELLVGRLPIDIRGKMLHEAARLVQEQDPPSLRTSVRTIATDVDTIVRTALAKEKPRRYQSAEALAEDVRRFLASKPIAARPPSTWDQLVKFSKRNRPLVSAVLAIFVVLVAALVVTGVFLNRAVVARAEADAERAEAQTVLGILTEALAAANPAEQVGGEYTVRDLLDDIAPSLDSDRQLQPATEATVRMVLGESYVGLGRYDDALNEFRGAQSLFAAAGGDVDEPTLNAETQAAAALLDLGRYEEGFEAFDSLVARSERAFGDDHPSTLERLHYLGNAAYRVGEFEQARMCFERVIEARRRRGEDETAYQATTIASLALTLQRLDELELARETTEQSVALHGRVFGNEHPFTLTARANQALLLTSMDQADAAESILRDVLAIRQRDLASDHPEIGVTLALLSNACSAQGRHEQAVRLGQDGYAILSAALGAEHRYALSLAARMAVYYDALGQADEAARWREVASASNP